MDDFDYRKEFWNPVGRYEMGERWWPKQWAQMCQPLPQLELEFYVARLGGWGNVRVLTPQMLRGECRLDWHRPTDTHRRVLAATSCPEAWYVYAVRRASDG